jgi:glyoxylase-like metal-dependent hydrolase (beta-lactamase superfamily II)
MRSLLLEGDGRVILIDNGAGNKYDARFKDIFALEGCILNDSLRRAGFVAEDVTDVILTHLHFDHAGGSTTYDGERVVPKFKNAIYHLQQSHLESARTPNIRERASFLPDNFEPLAATGQLRTHQGEGQLFPGVDLMVVNGHTTAQQLVRISGKEGVVVFCADLLPTVHHLRAPWVMAYDVRPLTTVEEKAHFLNSALAGRWQLFFEHDPEVAVASLKETEQGIITSSPRRLEELF